MTLTIVVLDNKEKFLQFLDPDLCHLEETIEYGGLRTLSFEYKFQDLIEDKRLFRVGNKIWVQGDTNVDDCLYVINTEVSQDIYDENSFSVEIEEVLVELNYAPVFSQTELYYWVDNETGKIYKTDNEAKEARGNDWQNYVKRFFTLKNENGQLEVVVDWNALNYWFGDYFNLGVIQSCISEHASRISITGTINRMDLLRIIEEETGNVFVTRYEKDILDNTIHRYLDFLNPININKDWMWNLEYDFNNVENVSACFDENGNIVTEDKDWEVIRYENTAFDPETIDEDTDTSHEDDYDVPQDDPYDSESQQIYPYEEDMDYTPIRNLNPNNCQFQITDSKYRLLNTEGKPYTQGDTALAWICSDVGMTDVDYPRYIITLQRIGNILAISVNNKNYAIAGIGDNDKPLIPELRDEGHISYNQDTERSTSKIPDDSYFEIYDHESNYCIFRSKLNTEIGQVHEEILDFGFNLENIKFNVDESETYTAVSPVITVNENADRNNLSRTDLDTIINRWLDLEIKKGVTVPMIVEKFNIEGTSYQDAVSKLGNSTRNSNYWIRPLKPSDNTDSETKQYEFYRAVAYWRAPYTKNAGEMYVSTDKVQNVEYTSVNTRPDTRQDKGMITTPKMGNTETTDEDVFMIYNQVCTYLKEHETHNIDIELDVANLQGHEYNNYNLHDKIYVKLANTQELITARITKTSKEAHDIAKNTIEVSNYRNINTIKTITHETYIEAPNSSFKYPASKTLTARLINNAPDETTDTYLANKLLVFTVYKLENQSSTLTGQVYTKLTDAYGYAHVNLKFDPGDYEINIQFAGDEEYEESNLVVNVNVSGTIPKPTTTTNTTSNSNKTNKTKTIKTKKKKIVKLYWNKCGLSPDKKHKEIVSIAKPSGPDAGKYAYRYYKTVFKNYCPICGKSGYLRFDGGKKNKCITSAGAHGRGYKIGVPEHEITCNYCDSDYCGVTGAEKWYTVRGRLKTVKKPVKSSEKEFNKLVKGKLVYGTKTITVTTKKVVNNKDRKIRAKGISNRIKKQALSIVGNSTGWAAMKKIVHWCDKNIKYAGYPNFVRSASSVLKRGSGNCCDSTRFFFEICDAAGLCEYFNFYYVHVPGHVYGIVETKKTKKWRYVDMASDRHGCWGYVCQGYPHGSRTSKYPKLPF